MQAQAIVKIFVVGAVLALTACAANDPYRRTKVGAGVGAATGAVIGHQIADRTGPYIGAAAGALVGGAIGNYMDRQQQAFEQSLAEERRRHNLEVQRLRDGSIKIDIPSEITFDFNSAAIKPAFTPTLDKVSNILQQYDRTRIEIIGHTDSVGSDAYNLELSQRRAESVAAYLSARGVPQWRLLTSGRGKREPRASNATAAGRQLNRRVEMLIRPTDEQQTAAAPPPDPRFNPPPDPRFNPPPQNQPGAWSDPYGTPSGGSYAAPPPDQRYGPPPADYGTAPRY